MSRAPTWAIVPVKALSDAKQRLAPVLPLAARHRLMLVMLLDVLVALRQVEELGRILIVTPDAEVADVAQGRGAQVLREARVTGHSGAGVGGPRVGPVARCGPGPDAAGRRPACHPWNFAYSAPSSIEMIAVSPSSHRATATAPMRYCVAAGRLHPPLWPWQLRPPSHPGRWGGIACRTRRSRARPRRRRAGRPRRADASHCTPTRAIRVPLEPIRACPVEVDQS